LDQGIFLNGKNQIIEMLKHMPQNEKERLLKNLKHRNPQLADELMHQSFQFEDLHKMTDIELKAVFHHVTAPIVGIAIRNVSVEFQKRVLSLSPRTYAEDAYEYMTRRMSNEARDIKRAQNKILEILVPVLKKTRVSV